MPLGSPVRLLLALALCVGAAAFAVTPARASSRIQYGIQDDGWLLYGGGTIDYKVEVLQRLGVDVVRYTIRWDRVARRQPADARDHTSPAYDWRAEDPILRGLRSGGIDVVVTLLGTPDWANGGRAFNWAPSGQRSFADFAYAAARRYPWIRKWTIWNEPNQARWLRPTSPAVYVEQLLNPAYAAIHSATRGAVVAGGVTAPRAGAGGGQSPVAWIRGMGAAGARLDAYAHHPYPVRPSSETPSQGGCAHCSTITMANLERLVREVRQSFGRKRIWLTEYGYQTNPPDRTLGVALVTQAHHLSAASYRAFLAPDVDMLIQYLLYDDAEPAGWQSGLFTQPGAVKPAYWAFRLPVTQVRRLGDQAEFWGQVRPGSGRLAYRVRLYEGGRWRRVGGIRRTDGRGVFVATVRARRGSLLQVWSMRDQRYSVALRVR
jgi:hypothetical protein